MKDIARESSRAAVDESVDQITDEDNAQQLAAAIADPRFEEALARITEHITDGVLKSLAAEGTHKQLQALTAMAADTVARQLVNTLGSAQTREHVELLMASITQSAVRSVGSALAEDFIPSMQGALEGELARSAATGLTGPLHTAIGATSQNVAYNAVLGANDALRATWLGDTGSDVRSLASAGVPWLKFAFWALALFTLCLLCIAAIVIARGRQARTEVRRLETATLLLATAMRERHDSAETDEIVTVVRDALEKSAHDHQRHGLLGILRMRHH